MCTLCRRNLLAGERFRYWRAEVSSPGARIVCGLCESRAERDGWLRLAQAPRRENAVGLRGSVRLVA